MNINIRHYIGIGELLFSWLCSYLTNKVQWVNILSISSDYYTPPFGVPQGTALSPILFALFVNSAVSVLRHTKLLIFADDMNVFFRIQSIPYCQPLQNDPQRLAAWWKSLGFFPNISKCSVITFCRNNTLIKYTNSFNNTYSILKIPNNSAKDLVFILTLTIWPYKYIDTICYKTFKLLGFLIRVSIEFQLFTSLKIVFCSLVRSYLWICLYTIEPFYRCCLYHDWKGPKQKNKIHCHAANKLYLLFPFLGYILV